MVPSDADAERAYLGSIIGDPDVLLFNHVDASDFYFEKNRLVYQSIMRLADSSKEIDFLTIVNSLEEKAQLATVGGTSYIVSLINAVPTSLHAKEYAEQIKRTAFLRRVILASTEIAEIGYDPKGENDQEILTKIQGAVTKIEKESTDDELETWQDAAVNYLPKFYEYADGQSKPGVPTGLSCIDDLIGGLPRGEMTIVAADPGMGKTHLAQTITFNAGTKGQRGIFFSLEMTRDQLMTRYYAERGNVNAGKIQRARISESEKKNILDRVDTSSNIPVLISDKPRDTAGILRAIIKAERRYGKIDFVVIDYSLLLRDKAENEIARNMQMAANLKNIAKQTGVALLLVHPISRESDPSEPPDLRNLGWGRSWEYNAYLVLFPFFDKKREDAKAIIKIGKWRDGEPGAKLDAYFDGTRWGDLKC